MGDDRGRKCHKGPRRVNDCTTATEGMASSESGGGPGRADKTALGSSSVSVLKDVLLFERRIVFEAMVIETAFQYAVF